MILTTTQTIEGRSIAAYQGIVVDYEIIGDSMMIVSVSGTAVRLA